MAINEKCEGKTPEKIKRWSLREIALYLLKKEKIGFFKAKQKNILDFEGEFKYAESYLIDFAAEKGLIPEQDAIKSYKGKKIAMGVIYLEEGWFQLGYLEIEFVKEKYKQHVV